MKRLLVLFMVVALTLGAFSVAAQDESVTIQFVHIFGGENDNRGAIVQSIADAFMAANPNVTVEVSAPATDYTELFNNALLAAEQGNAPTIVQVEEGLTQLAADSGYFIPIGDVASEEQLASLDDLLDTVRAYYTIGDTLYSLPWNASNPVLYVNNDLLTAAGLDPALPPKTFDEILLACQAIMALPEPPPACLNFPLAAWFPEQWMAMQNALVADNDNGRSARATAVNYDSAEMLRIVDWIAVMDEAGYFSYSGTPGDYNGEAIAFLSGQTAMTINSTAGLALIQQFAEAAGFELGVAPLPTPGEDATNGVTVGGASLWITAGHTDAETQAAVDFVFFLTNTENIMTWHQGTGYFPTRVSAIEQLTADGWFEENPDFAIAITQLQESAGNIANAGAIFGPAAEIRQLLVQAIQSVIDGGETPADALASAQAQADAVLTEYNALVE
ncbi:MAG: ABC transporter substrate-binding protein [Chloroflexota bacterium]|nr:ABC transporter substrate-binding protein [Chloroflexota bacterium]